MNGIDLHTHSDFSDGELSPDQLLALAQQQHIHTLALTDHDTLSGYYKVQSIAHRYHLHLISGVELSVSWQRLNQKKCVPIHVLALNMSDFDPIEAILDTQKKLRAQRGILICQKLMPIVEFDLLHEVRMMVEGHDDRITRNHIAQVLLQHTVVTRKQQAFDRFLGQGKRAYVAFEGIELAQAIENIRQCGGVAVLAHPTKYALSATLTRELIQDFARLGGHAIELPSAHEPPAMRHV